MSTGYTADISKGITFQEFAMGCARAFAACVSMRDDPSDKPIPEKFQPSAWHKEELKKANDRLEQLASMDLVEAQILARQEYADEFARINESIIKDRELMGQYKDMLRQAKHYQPPTPDHVEFKAFMISQIETSIKFDGMEDYYIEHQPELLSGKEWLRYAKAKAQRDIDYHTKENIAEIERTNQRNEWVSALRESLYG